MYWRLYLRYNIIEVTLFQTKDDNIKEMFLLCRLIFLLLSLLKQGWVARSLIVAWVLTWTWPCSYYKAMHIQATNVTEHVPVISLHPCSLRSLHSDTVKGFTQSTV